MKRRLIPYILREDVKNKLIKLVGKAIIMAVEPFGWATPIVTSLKADEEIPPDIKYSTIATELYH